MIHARKIRPLHAIVLITLVVLLPLGGVTLATALGASPVLWLLPNASRNAIDRDATLRRMTDVERSRSLSTKGANHMLHASFVASVPTPTPAAVFLPVVTR